MSTGNVKWIRRVYAIKSVIYVLSTFTFLISLFLFPAFKGLNLEDFSPG